MDFSLSSSLVGSAVSNPDKLALDLQFATDKTLTARKGPTPTFTRASSGTFVGSDGLIQSAGNNVARFDHDPESLACNGLLIEESRTNLIIQSENFGAASWSKGGSNITVNTQTAPDGNVTADTLNVTTQYANVLGTVAIGVVAGQSYTASFWCKRGTATDLKYSVRNENNFSMIVPETSYYSQTSTEWRRISLSFVIPTGCSSIVVRINNNSSSLGTVHFWGAQLEAGSFPTSYIPTTTASAVRSADVCSITGSAFSGFYNQTEGTALVKTIGGDSTSSRDLFKFSETIAPIDSIFISGYSRFLAVEVNIITNNSQQFVHFGSLTRNFERLSLAYAQNNAAYARNGTIEATDTSVTTSSSIIQLFLGAGGINGCISSFSYYKKRLSNAKLQILTA